MSPAWDGAWVLDAVRTPRGRGKPGSGALARVHPQELLAQLLRGLERRGTLRTERVDDVLVGCVSQVGEQGANLARQAVLAARWPLTIPGVTLNRVCGSGLQAVHFGAMAVASGAMDLVVAGGVESMSRVPMGADGGGQDGGNTHLRRDLLQLPQGLSADLIATLEGFSRAQLDEVALRSQRGAERARAEGRFLRSLVPVRDPESGAVLLESDETPRPGSTLEGLAGLRSSFAELGASPAFPGARSWDERTRAVVPGLDLLQHEHTAGNSSGLADGAAAVVLASDHYVRATGVRPRARLRALATVGSDPLLKLTAPAPVSEKALRLAGLRVQDIDLWEINEAFAAVVLQTTRALDIDPARVNVNGGSIALGHPLGATGAMLLGTALDELERSSGELALIALCIGGGQGIAAVLERA